MNKIIIFCFLLFILISCAKSYDNLSPEYQNNNGVDVELIADSTQFNALLTQSKSDRFEIDSAFIAENWLICNVSYAGGCANHHFKAYWSQKIAKDSIAETQIIITHEANSDTCKTFIKQQISINLSWLTNLQNSEYDPIIYHLINNSTNEIYTLE